MNFKEKLKEITKAERIVFFVLLALAAALIVLVILDFSGVCFGISDVSPLLLGTGLILNFYLRRNGSDKAMNWFCLVCGILMVLLYIAEIILDKIYN